MDYKEWAEKQKGKAIEERKKLESIKTKKINMESKAKKQKSSTGEKIAFFEMQKQNMMSETVSES